MLNYQFPFERYPTAEGWTVTEGGGTGGQVLLADGSISGRGTKCILCDGTTYGKLAYITRSYTLNPGQYGYVSFYWQIPNPADQDSLSRAVVTSGLYLYKQYSGTLRFKPNDATGADFSRYTEFPFGAGGHLTVGIKRATTVDATDGECVLYVNGVLKHTVTGLKNYTQAAGSTMRLGKANSNFVLSDKFDEVRFGSTLADVLPSSTTPPAATGDLPQAARTIVLFNQNNADSLTFAQSITAAETLLCPLPCSTTETLADYATFVNEVEHPLKNFLAFQPAVASQATCIIAGHMVPGYFNNSGSLLSTCSRLMDIDNTFSAVKTNPLYGTSARLTKTALNAAGVRIAARIDGTALADCTALKTLGDISVAVAENKKIFMSGAPQLDHQLLRLPIKSLAAGDIVTGDAINFNIPAVAGTSTASESAGDRLSIIFNNTTDITRDEITYATSDWHYRSLILSSASYAFDFAAFCRMLRSGGTIAEAFAVASQKVNAKYVLFAWPFMTASFPVSGYNVFDIDTRKAATDPTTKTAQIQVTLT